MNHANDLAERLHFLIRRAEEFDVQGSCDRAPVFQWSEEAHWLLNRLPQDQERFARYAFSDLPPRVQVKQCVGILQDVLTLLNKCSLTRAAPTRSAVP